MTDLQGVDEKNKCSDTGKTVLVDVSHLQDVNVSRGLGRYLAEIWFRRDFIVADAKAKAFRTTRDYKWWRFWLIASPILEALLYGVMFGLLLRTSRGIENYVGFVIIGISVFNVMNRLMNAGVGLVEANKGLMRAFSFPAATVALSTILRYAYDLAPSVVISSLAALAFQFLYTPPGVALFFTPFVLLLTFMFGAGLTFITARLTSFLPDFRALLELFGRGWMFASGIFYSMERYATNPVVYEVFTANPAYQFLTAFRDCLIYNRIPSLGEWVTMVLWGFGTLAVGFIFFWRADQRYSQEF